MSLRTEAIAAATAVVVLLTSVIAFGFIANADDARKISLHNIHTKDTITVIYKKNGRYVPAAMKKINWVMRDWRRDESAKMDPKLIDILWEMHSELGSQKPIHVISGYRSLKTNNLLRKTRGGQARRSRHILGKAADVHFPDVPIKQLRYSALVRQRGGVGYYPTSALPFVHVDTGRVRHWPRMPRHELALLFPNGKTKHRPSRGGPITKRDYWKARRTHKRLAKQVTAYRAARGRPRSTLVAAASPESFPAPTLSRQPTLAKRPARPRQRARRVAALDPAAISPPVRNPVTAQRTRNARPSDVANQERPSQSDRSRLNDLFKLAAFMDEPKLSAAPQIAQRRDEQPRIRQAALGDTFSLPKALNAAKEFALGGNDESAASRQQKMAALALSDELTTEPKSELDNARMGYAGQWIPAPAYDDEHPEELSYRPFPLAPLLTQSSSPDDPILAHMIAPDPEATLDLLTDDGSAHRMRFVPGKQIAALLWATQFSGEAVNLGALQQKLPKTPSRNKLGLSKRSVKISQR